MITTMEMPPATLPFSQQGIWTRRLLCLPAPLLLVTMAALWAADLRTPYESPRLLFALTFVFSTLVFLFVAYLVGRSFLVRGAPGLLMLGCGVVILGVAGLAAAAVDRRSANAAVTIFNLGVWLSAICHLAGVSPWLRRKGTIHMPGPWLATAYALALGTMGLISLAALEGWTPTFFVQGQGGTAIRQAVLVSAIAMFGLAAALLRAGGRKSVSSFAYWYALALVLIATGLFGVMVQPSLFSPLFWTGRAAGFLGGAYILVAAIVSVRESRVWGISLEASLSEARQQFEDLFNLAADGIVVHELASEPARGRFIQVNPAICDLLGYSLEQMLRLTPLDIVVPEDRQTVTQDAEKLARDGVLRHEKTLVAKDGRQIAVEISTRLFRHQGRPMVMSAIRNITGRKGAEREREIAMEFLRLVNAGAGTRETIQAAATFFQDQSGCQAVGIRLREGDDYPYYEARGFPREFLLAENSLCSRDCNGQIERDPAGNPIIACMCGNVICGRFDPSKPFFTENGSFWTNCTTQLLATSTEADRQARTRNRCNGQGYESVALIRLRCGHEQIGLLQLNDRRPDMFTPEVIALWERLAGYLAVALAKSRAEESLRESEQKSRSAFANAAIGFAIARPDGRFVDANPAYCTLTGYGIEELRSLAFSQLIDPDDFAENMKSIDRMLAGQIADFVVENRYRRKDGHVVWVRKSVSLVRSADGTPQWIIALVEDVTERKQADANQALLTDILQCLNRGGSLHALVVETLRLVRDATGFDAVGLRLRQGEDYPYFENNGFSQEFLQEENLLCEQGSNGAIVRDARGRAVLQCTCGLVLSGRTDPRMPCFTESGSFWTNLSNELLSLPRQADPRTNSRNRCIHAGYLSIGLFPVKAGGEIIGLLQLNDRRSGRFTPELIAFYESLAQNIGLALQRTAAEEALRQRAEEVERLLDVVPAAVWVAHDPQCLVITGNRRANEFYEVAAGENVSANTLPEARRFFTPDGRELAASELPMQVAVATNQDLHDVELHVLLPSERRIAMLGSVFPLRNEDGQVRGCIGAFLDITERKQAEQQLKALNETLERRVAERTAEADQRAEQLRALAAQLTQAEQRERQRLATILHDHLQQLLVGTKFHLGVLRGQLQAPQQRELLKQVDNLLDESLDASRSLTVDLCPPILQQGTMPQVLEWLGEWFDVKHGLTVAVHADAQANPPAQEVRVLLFQAVRELLFNVVKHSKVKQACVELSRAAGGHIMVVVSDAGEGFDPSQPSMDTHEGSGFGLFNIRERLDWLGGGLEIQSSPGQGTRAMLLAPMQLKAQSAHAPAALEVAEDSDAQAANRTTDAWGGKVRVLLADDHAVMRDGLTRLLQAQPDIEVVGQAADGPQVIELARQLQPDVIIMDINMPHMDGLEATRQVKAHRPQVQVIGLSMFTEASVAEGMKAAGAAQYLAKTSGPEALIAAIRACIGTS